MPDTSAPSRASQPPQEAAQAVGLGAADAARRLARTAPTCCPAVPRAPCGDMVRGVFTEPMFLMLLVAGGIYLLLGDRAEAALLLAFVFVVIGITLAQERKTQRALESLRDLSAPRALVIRDGAGGAHRRARRGARRPAGAARRRPRGSRRRAGAGPVDGGRVPADGRGRAGGQAAVRPAPPLAPATSPEATAAGAPATPGGDGTPHLFASTVVTKGVGLARVSATGTATAVGRIGQALAATVEPPSGLQQSSRRLIVQLTVAGLMLATAQILLGWLWDGHSLLASVLSGIALAMAILPEEIPVILTVFLALGAWRISQSKVLTRRMSAVEALGAITVLATDKTGTLTQNVMRVAELRAGGASFSPRRRRRACPRRSTFWLNLRCSPRPPTRSIRWKKPSSSSAAQWLEGTEHVHADWTPATTYALSPDILAMTLVFASDGPGEHLLATKGAPEAVMDLCHLPPGRARRHRAPRCWRWPNAACACSAWRAVLAGPRHRGRRRPGRRPMAGQPARLHIQFPRSGRLRGPAARRSARRAGRMPRRRRARDHDDRRPPGHGQRHRAAGGPERPPRRADRPRNRSAGRRRAAHAPAPGRPVRAPAARAEAAPGAGCCSRTAKSSR